MVVYDNGVADDMSVLSPVPDTNPSMVPSRVCSGSVCSMNQEAVAVVPDTNPSMIPLPACSGSVCSMNQEAAVGAFIGDNGKRRRVTDDCPGAVVLPIGDVNNGVPTEDIDSIAQVSL